MRALISVIIPAYNIEQYIGRCLDSVLNQTYDNLEILVIDDGSADQTGTVLDQYASKDNRITVLHQKNQGVSAARNRGLSEATGEYIGFVDGDDVIEPDMYETLINLIEEEEADIAHCGYQMVFPDRVDYYHNTKQKKLQNNIEGLKDLLSGQLVEPALVNKLYRKQILDHIILDSGIRINEDLLYNYHAFKKSRKSVFYDVPLYHYMIRKGSATSATRHAGKAKDSLKVMRIILSDAEKELKPVVYYRYIYLLMGISRSHIDDVEYQAFQREIKKELRKESKKKYFQKYICGKLRYMVLGVLYFPHCFRLIYKIYDYKTGISKKYKV